MPNVERKLQKMINVVSNHYKFAVQIDHQKILDSNMNVVRHLVFHVAQFPAQAAVHDAYWPYIVSCKVTTDYRPMRNETFLNRNLAINYIMTSRRCLLHWEQYHDVELFTNKTTFKWYYSFKINAWQIYNQSPRCWWSKEHHPLPLPVGHPAGLDGLVGCIDLTYLRDSLTNIRIRVLSPGRPSLGGMPHSPCYFLWAEYIYPCCALPQLVCSHVFGECWRVCY